MMDLTPYTPAQTKITSKIRRKTRLTGPSSILWWNLSINTKNPMSQTCNMNTQKTNLPIMTISPTIPIPKHPLAFQPIKTFPTPGKSLTSTNPPPKSPITKWNKKSPNSIHHPISIINPNTWWTPLNYLKSCPILPQAITIIQNKICQVMKIRDSIKFHLINLETLSFKP